LIKTSSPVTRQQRQGSEDKWINQTLTYLNEYGFLNMSLGRLAKELGVSKTALNHQFGSLDQLYAIILARILDGDVIALNEARARAPSVPAFFDDILDHYLNTATTPQARIELFVIGFREGGIYAEYSRTAGIGIRSAFSELLAADGCPEHQLEETGDFFMSLFNGALIQFSAWPDNRERIKTLVRTAGVSYSSIKAGWPS
jgi:AcrR family transcriptional regulator